MSTRNRVGQGLSAQKYKSLNNRASQPQYTSGHTRPINSLKLRVNNIEQTVSQDRSNRDPVSQIGSFLDDIETVSNSSGLETNTNSALITSLQDSIDSLEQQRNNASGVRKVELADQIIALQKQMIEETAKSQGSDATVTNATVEARDEFLESLQAVINEAQRYNETGEYREVISTNLLENLQDSMNSDFFKLVGTDMGTDLLDQVDQMGANLSQENIDFINRYTGVVDILYGDYQAELAAGDLNRTQDSAVNNRPPDLLRASMGERAQEQYETIQNYLYFSQVSGEVPVASRAQRRDAMQFLTNLDQIVELSGNIDNGSIAFDQQYVNGELSELQDDFQEVLGIAGTDQQGNFVAAVNRRLDALSPEGRAYVNEYLHLDELMNVPANPEYMTDIEKLTGIHLRAEPDEFFNNPIDKTFTTASDLSFVQRAELNGARAKLRVRINEAKASGKHDEANSLMLEYFRIDHILSLS